MDKFIPQCITSQNSLLYINVTGLNPRVEFDNFYEGSKITFFPSNLEWLSSNPFDKSSGCFLDNFQLTKEVLFISIVYPFLIRE